MGDLAGPVEVVGAGLLGTSIGLACRRAGLEVLLREVSAAHLRTASGLGAGRPATDDDRPGLVVVAVPPDLLGEAVAEALERTARHGAVVTDVGSVKSGPLRALAEQVAPEQLTRYVGCHPMAGSERSGPLAASAALFEGRPWAITPHATSSPKAVAAVEELARLCGAVTSRLEPGEHDRAVARTSHLPHLAAVLVAARMADAPPEHLALSGQGVRDVTRVAASDPALWRQIVGANSTAVHALLAEMREQLDELMSAMAAGQGDIVARVLDQGVAGTRAIPGKHGGLARPTVSVFVAVPDHPGELARLFADAGDAGVNIEDVRIDHDPGRPVGQLELVVAEERAAHLLGALESRGWTTHR